MKKRLSRIAALALVALATVIGASAAFGAAANWDGYNVATVDAPAGQAKASNIYGPNPLHSNRQTIHRVKNATTGVNGPWVVIDGDPGSGMPTSSPGVGSTATWGLGACVSGNVYVAQAKITTDTMVGGSAIVSGPGKVLC